jgi:hypothetical protein
MIPVLARHLSATAHVIAAQLTHPRDRRPRAHDDTGAGTLETVILVLGGISLATLLVGALTVAVHNYIAKIK